ncbi:hypothetical protein Cni_G08712 [Canna indica]|uniref:SHSP domain-containing protein n=1 Tax=Canna indica TaxID=4628 RepID=A0AAQ3Q852_9LILI|nr:hypothetical protein Cni_G08712 [Canna indica]
MSIVSSLFGRKKNKVASQEPTMVDIWDPLEGFAFATTAMTVSHPVATTHMDWKETPDAHVFIADLPGLKKEEVNIELEEEKVLKISGQRTRESEEKGDKWHRIERSNEKFFRSVKLPKNANIDDMKAELVDGVLTVTVPKENDKKPQTRLLKIN